MNLAPLPDEGKFKRYKSKSGWLKLIPSKPQAILKTYVFPLFYSEVYTIGGNLNNDLVLPLDELSQTIIRISSHKIRQTTGVCGCGDVYKFYFQIVIKNVSSETTSEDLVVNGNILKPNEKLIVDFSSQSHVDLKFGSFDYYLCKDYAPNYDFLIKFSWWTGCSYCSDFWIDPCPLPCGHIFCKVCIETLCQKASDQVNEYFRSESYSEEEVERLSKVKCQDCEFTLPFPEVIKIQPHSLLSSLSLNASLLHKNENLYCANCDNVRCIANMNDFWKCRTCDSICCQLCALELHRQHEIQSVYSLILKKSYMKFDLYTFKVEKQYLCIHKSIMKVINRMNKVLNAFENQMEIATKFLNTNLTQVKKQCNRLNYVERTLDGEGIDTQRIECLQLFQAAILTTEQTLITATRNINAKASIIGEIELRTVCKSFE